MYYTDVVLYRYGSVCEISSRTDFKQFAYFRLSLDVFLNEYDIDFQFGCYDNTLYVDNKIADIILKFFDISIVHGNYKESKLQLYN